jgi:YHS domain-containing protein
VTDPVCGLVLDPEWALVRGEADGTSQSFCSESCAAAWSDTHQVVGRAEP